MCLILCIKINYILTKHHLHKDHERTQLVIENGLVTNPVLTSQCNLLLLRLLNIFNGNPNGKISLIKDYTFHNKDFSIIIYSRNVPL